MRTFTVNIDDIDQFICGLAEDDWHSDYLQLSSGPLNFQSQIVELPGITLFWNHFGARMRIKEAYIGDKVIFGWVFPSDKTFLYRGHVFLPNEAVIEHPGTEHDYIVPAGLDSLVIHIDRTLFEDLGMCLSASVEQLLPMASLRALVKECRTATKFITQLPHTQNNEAIEKKLRNSILLRLQEAMAPWAETSKQNIVYEPHANRDYLLFKRAENLILELGLGKHPSISYLADRLGVSKRSLYYAFKKWTGMGPNTFFEIKRLHYVRDRLLAGKPSTTNVTNAANELGFNHLGRFAGLYFEFFGEYPSDTLNRSEDN